MPTSAVDLSKLAAPTLLSNVSFEQERAALEAELRARYDGELADDLTSDPIGKQFDAVAYRMTLLRQEFNEGATANMLAFANNEDLDHWGANFNVPRLVLDEGDPDAVPPVAPTYESNTDYRNRLQLIWEGITNAGTLSAYRYYAISADAAVKSVNVTQPTPGSVQVTILDSDGDGTPSGTLITTVEGALNAEDVRPLTDTVNVVGATIVNYDVTAELTIGDGPDASLVLSAAQAALESYVASRHAVGVSVPRSGIIAALHVAGVEAVDLTLPAADIDITATEAGYCNSINVTEAA